MSRIPLVEPTDSSSDKPTEADEATTEDRKVEAAEVAAPELPEKYAGKSIEDVIAMHQNLEKEYGRQSSEVGTYRELVSSLTASHTAESASKVDTTDEPVEVTSDLLFDNPTEAIASVVKRVLQSELEPIKTQSASASKQAAIQQLSSIHPDAETIGADPKFEEFVSSHPYRVADAQSWLNNSDVSAADRLITDFKAAYANKAEDTPEKRSASVESARKSSTESGRGGAGASSGKKIFYRNDVMKMIASNPEKYRSATFQNELQQAIAEGRFKD